MREATDALKEVIAGGSFSMRLIVDAFNVAGERTLFGLEADRWTLLWNAEAELKSMGTVRIVHVSDDGSSIAPVKESDPLAPYGQEVSLLVEVSAGAFTETVQLGYFRIADVPRSSDAFADFRSGQIVTASMVELTLEDRLSHVRRRGFRAEENPESTSAWDEMARITGMQVLRSVADATVPEDMVYQAARYGRLRAVQQLAGALGGTEYTNPDGALTVIPAEAGDPVGTLRRGEFGTIIGDDGGMDSTEVFNVVVGDFETPERLPIHKEAVASGALSPAKILENTHYFHDATVTTESDAVAAVAAELARVSRPAKRISVQAVVDPLIEIGDVRTVDRDDGSTITAQVVSVDMSGSPQMTVGMDVIADAV